MFPFTNQTLVRCIHRTEINGKQHWNHEKQNDLGKVNVKYELVYVYRILLKHNKQLTLTLQKINLQIYLTNFNNLV